MKTYAEILAELNRHRAYMYNSDPERTEVLTEATTMAVVHMLEIFAESERQQQNAMQKAL